MGLNFKSFVPEGGAYQGGKSKSDLEKDGSKVYKLSSNENAIGPSPKAVEAIKKQLSTISEYPSPNDSRFRHALCAFYNRLLTPEQFVTTNSGVANIELIIRGFADEQSETIYSSPYFGPYNEFSQKMGACTIDVPLVGDEFELDLANIESAINEKTSLLFITSPNNPTGSYIRKSQIDDLLSFLPNHVLLVFDEVYHQFAHAKDYVRALPYVLEGKNVIAINSMSKAYGLAGLRVGYSFSTAEIAQYLQRFRRPFMINALSTEAAIAALQDETFIDETVELIHREKAFLYDSLDKLNIVYWKTQANFIMIRPDISPKEFESRMIDEGVMVRPLTGFGAPDCVRITIGKRDANEAFIRGLTRIIET